MHAQLGEVSIWYAEHGAGDPVICLHGGVSDSRELDPPVALDFLGSGPVRTILPSRRA